MFIAPSNLFKSAQKVLLCLGIGALLFSSTARAEESGEFIGLGVGFHNLKTVSAPEGANTTTTTTSGVLGYEIMFGYNKFYTPRQNVALRFYFDVFYHPNFNANANNTKMAYLGTYFNLDGMINFVDNEYFRLGLYAGVGGGAGTYFTNADITGTKTRPNVLLNGGVRFVIANEHGFEIGVKMPMLQDAGLTYVGNNAGLTITHQYNVALRYTYNFHVFY